MKDEKLEDLLFDLESAAADIINDNSSTDEHIAVREYVESLLAEKDNTIAQFKALLAFAVFAQQGFDIPVEVLEYVMNKHDAIMTTDKQKTYEEIFEDAGWHDIPWGFGSRMVH